MTPSGKIDAPGDSGDMGEWRIQDVAAAMVGLPGGVVSEVVGASAFLGGNTYSCEPSVHVPLSITLHRRLTYPPYSSYPKSLRQVPSTRVPGVPWCLGTVCVQEILQELFSALACYWGYF